MGTHQTQNPRSDAFFCGGGDQKNNKSGGSLWFVQRKVIRFLYTWLKFGVVKSSRFSISMKIKFTALSNDATNRKQFFFNANKKYWSRQWKKTTCSYVRILQHALEWDRFVNDATFMFACWKHDIIMIPHINKRKLQHRSNKKRTHTSKG